MRSLVAVTIMLAAAAPALAGDYADRKTELSRWADGLELKNKAAFKTALDAHATLVDACLDGLVNLVNGSRCKDKACKDEWLAAIKAASDSADNLLKSLTAAEPEMSDPVKKGVDTVMSEEKEFVKGLNAAADLGAGMGWMVDLRAQVAKQRADVVGKVVPALVQNGAAVKRGGNESFDRLVNRIQELQRDMAKAELLCMDALNNAAKELGVAFNDFDQIKVAYAQWDRQIVELRQIYRKDVYAIAEALCEYEPKDDETLRTINGVADRIGSEIRSMKSTIDSVGNNLLGRLGSLSSAAPTDQVNKLKEEITKKLTSVEKSTRNVLQGSNNPKTRTKLETGKAMHAQKENSCHAREISVAGGSTRIDCLIVRSSVCYVTEIKPDGSRRARSKGESQASRGVEGATNDFNRVKNDDVEKFFSGNSGRNAVFKGCYDKNSNSLDVRPYLDPYPWPCPIPEDEIADKMEEY